MTTTVNNGGGPVRDDPVWANDYDVERTLGHDPLGWTCLARSRLSGRSVVITVLADHLAGEEKMRARFRRATELGMRLSHPNVVRVFESGLGRSPYVITEHIEGESLAERLRRSGRFGGGETTRLAIQLAAGLAHAHANGVTHGALTPERIVLGGDDVARIGDFGLARLLTPALSQTQDVYDFAVVLRQVGGDRLPPGLAAIVDAATAHPSARPSVFDVLHELHTITSPPNVWLPSAAASGWSVATQLDVADVVPDPETVPTTAAADCAVAASVRVSR